MIIPRELVTVDHKMYTKKLSVRKKGGRELYRMTCERMKQSTT